MAGEVINCSKCKKKVRAPDRRVKSANAPPLPNDGIPIATMEETRAELEERLKLEEESRIEAERKLTDIDGARIKAEELSKQQGERLAQLEKEHKELTETKASLMERLKTVGDAPGNGQNSGVIEAEIAAREKAEKAARDLETKIAALDGELNNQKAAKEQAEKQAVDAQQKYQQEARAHQTTQSKLTAESQSKAGIENQLKAEIERRTKAESELKTKAGIEERFENQLQEMNKLESQLKAETSARLRSQAQLEQEIEKRNRMQKEVSMMQIQTDTHKEVKFVEKPRDYHKGVLRLIMVLSVMAAIFGGVFEYYYGYANYILNRYFNDSALLLYVNRPHLVPINLVIFGVATFIFVWLLYLPVRFVIGGFSGESGPEVRKTKKEVSVVEEQSDARPQFLHGMWRS
jgi:chemotaxis protein histidine kinase CheA